MVPCINLYLLGWSCEKRCCFLDVWECLRGVVFVCFVFLLGKSVSDRSRQYCRKAKFSTPPPFSFSFSLSLSLNWLM